MKLIYLISALAINIQPVQAQTTANYQKALTILNKAIQATGKPIPNCVLVNSSGTIHNLGHYETPEKTKEIPIEETVSFFQDEQVAYLHSVIQNNGGSYVRVVVSKADSLYSIGYYNRTPVRGTAQDFRYETARLLPSKLLHFAREHRQSLRYLGELEGHFLLSFSYKSNTAVTLSINNRTYLLDKTETLGYHDRYGDVTFSSEYKEYEDKNGLKIPKNRNDYEFGKAERNITYKDIQFGVKPDTSDLKIKWTPVAFRNALPQIIKKSESLSFETIAPNVDLVKITSQNNKVLIVQFADHTALFESPSGIGLNIQILHEIQQRYPKKPLRQIFLTHHHPDHAGGIRAFAEMPVTFITTPGNETYFRKLLGNTHTLNETKLLSTKAYKFDFVPTDGKKLYKDAQTEVIAYEIGKGTSHTAEHLVFYFPQQKLLWSGDLLFFRADGRLIPMGDRGKAVYELITDQNLAVDRIYTSWPLNDQATYGSVADLRKSIGVK